MREERIGDERGEEGGRWGEIIRAGALVDRVRCVVHFQSAEDKLSSIDDLSEPLRRRRAPYPFFL